MYAVLLHVVLSLLLSHGTALDRPTALFQRQQPPANPELIDPVLQPYCAASSCWHWGSPPPELCPLVEGPCANDTNASDNMPSAPLDGSIPKCGIRQYRRDCYCNLKTGLSCAWNCNWATWYIHPPSSPFKFQIPSSTRGH